MTITGPRLAESDAAQAFLTDMADRRTYVRQAIDGALDRLADLPTTDGWKPCDEEEARATEHVYVRGVLACGLVVDKATGREEFYTGRDFAVRGARVDFLEEEPNLGLLLRVNDTLTAAGVVYGVLDGLASFGPHSQQHAEVLMRLRDVAQAATKVKLNEQKGS